MHSLLRPHRGPWCIAIVLALASGLCAQETKQKKTDDKQPDAKKSGTKSEETKEPAKTDEGRAQLIKAYEVSKTASSPKEYAQMIELCEQGIAGTTSDTYKAYGKKLAAWAYFKRGEALAGA